MSTSSTITTTANNTVFVSLYLVVNTTNPDEKFQDGSSPEAQQISRAFRYLNYNLFNELPMDSLNNNAQLVQEEYVGKNGNLSVIYDNDICQVLYFSSCYPNDDALASQQQQNQFHCHRAYFNYYIRSSWEKNQETICQQIWNVTWLGYQRGMLQQAVIAAEIDASNTNIQLHPESFEMCVPYDQEILAVSPTGFECDSCDCCGETYSCENCNLFGPFILFLICLLVVAVLVGGCLFVFCMIRRKRNNAAIARHATDVVAVQQSNQKSLEDPTLHSSNNVSQEP